MSTWLDDIKRTNPALAADYAIVGNQDKHSLQAMAKALSMLPGLNTPEENKRLAAARRILTARKGWK